MNRPRARSSWIAALTAVALMTVGGLASAATKPFDQLVPEDVTDYYVLQNYRACLGKLKASPYGGLIEEPEVKALFDQITAKASEHVAKFKEQMGVTPGEIEQLLDGQIALAMKREMGAGGLFGGMGMGEAHAPPRFWVLVLVDLGPNGAKAEQLLNRALELAAKEEGVQVADEEFRGHKVRHITSKPKPAMSQEELDKLDPELRKMMQDMKNKGGEQMFHAYLNLEGGILAVLAGVDRSLLEQHLVLRDGGDAVPLSKCKLYGSLLERVDADNDYLSFQNYELLWEDMMKNAAQPQGFMPFSPARLLEALGVFGIKGQVASAKIGPEGISSRAFLSVPAPRKSILKAFEPEAGANVKPPAFVGADTAIYVGGYFNVPVFWEELKSVIQQLSPDAFAMMQQGINNPQMPVHIERDIINVLGSRWYLYVPEEVVNPTPPKSIHVLLATEAKDTGVLEKTMQKIMAMPEMEGKITTVEFMGKTIYQTPPVPFDENAFGPGAADFAPFQLSIVFVDNKVVLATSDSMAKRAVRDSRLEASPLLDKAEFRKMVANLLSKPDIILYADQRPLGEWVWKLANLIIEKTNAQFNLPKYETIKKYLYVSCTTAKWNEAGLEVRGWMPYPPGK